MKDNKKLIKYALIICSLVLISITIVSILYFFTAEQINTFGEYPNSKNDTSLNCENKDLAYFLFESLSPLSSSTKINMIIKDDNLSTISLIYISNYSNETTAIQSESIMMSQLNQSFGNEFGFNGLGANFSTNKTMVKMSLTATSSEIGDNGKKYFLLNSNTNSIADYRENFENQGFDCKINN